MKNTQIAQSSFEYLLMQVVMNRQKESESNDDSKEKIKRIGYDVGNRLTERFTDFEKPINRIDESIKYLLTAQWCKPFFDNPTLKYVESNKTYIITVLHSDFVSTISSFQIEKYNPIEIKEMYLSYLIGIIHGSLNSRGFKVDIHYPNIKNNFDHSFELTITQCD
ncbi:hypothetical protein ENUP19_0319G0002 [Entamoeba nuttalli]|uniref:Trafficking protein particle complex subunit n=1 Tax=Entamoeba nuttalli TaxID=412467 RepID=A0ABQ0DWE6_9EUKA